MVNVVYPADWLFALWQDVGHHSHTSKLSWSMLKMRTGSVEISVPLAHSRNRRGLWETQSPRDICWCIKNMLCIAQASCDEISGTITSAIINIGLLLQRDGYNSTIFTRGQFWPSGIVVASVCLSVCLCVRQSLACPRDNLSPVQARIIKFGPEEQNTLVKIPIVLGVNWPWTSRSNLT